MPAHFTQVLPEEGPPEPLDRGAYYVFQIERSSGSTSYQAVKVLADGSLQAYNAQPRAGSSYMLCCNVTSDFPEPVILPDTSQDAGSRKSAAARRISRSIRRSSRAICSSAGGIYPASVP